MGGRRGWVLAETRLWSEEGSEGVKHLVSGERTSNEGEEREENTWIEGRGKIV